MEDICFATASALAEDIRAGRLTAVEVLEAHLTQIARHNESLNAIVTLDEEGARRRAEAADAARRRGELWGPLHGVPVTIKEFHSVAGMRNTSGGHGDRLSFVASHDSTAPARLKAAGAVIMGLTNLYLRGSASVFGPSNNPWDLRRTSGTSSSGAAAALAAGLSALDVGGDGTGSILAPAHYCGVFGMRPTEHRVSMHGLIYYPEPAPIFRAVVVNGPIARSVSDLRLALQVIAGPDGLDPEVPPVAWREVEKPDVRSLRVAWTADFPGTLIGAEIKTAIEGLARDLERAGAYVKQTLPAVDLRAQHDLCWDLFGQMFGAFAPVAEGRAPVALADYFVALDQREALIAIWERFFTDWDILICPVDHGPAPLHGDTTPAVDGAPLPDDLRVHPCNVIPLTGQPAISMPLALDRSGLPLGVMLVSKRWSDEKLLAIAEIISDMTGGFRRPPGY